MLRSCLILIAATGFAQVALAAELTAPLLPAAKGKIQCYSPDPAHKTCKSMTSYRVGPRGDLESIATVLISSGPQVLMETIAPVEIIEGKVCGAISEHDFLGANISIDGRPADMQQTKQYTRQAAGSAKGLIGRYMCTSFVTDADKVKAKISVDNAPRPDMDQQVVWVALDDGYKIAN